MIQAGNTYTAYDPSSQGQLKLPSGMLIKDTNPGALYAELERLQIPGFSHNLGFSDAVGMYAKHLESIGTAAAEKAVAEWLEQNKQRG